jgi:hypothetical protein
MSVEAMATIAFCLTALSLAAVLGYFSRLK